MELATSDQSKLERFIFQNNNVINHGELVALCEKFTLDPSIPFDKKEDVILKLQAAMPGWDSTFGDKILLNWMKQLSDNELIQLRSKIKGIIDNPNGIKRDNFYKFYGPDGLVRMDIDIFKRAWRLGFFEKEKNTIPPQAHHWKNIFGRTVDAGNIAAIEFMLTDPTLYVNEELSPPYYSPLEGALGGTDLSIAELLLKNPRIQPSLETVERVYERYSAEAVELLFAYRSFTLDDYYKALSFQVVDDNNLGKSVENKKRSALLNKSTIDLGNGGPVLPPLFASIALKNFNLFSELMKDKKLNLKVKDQEGRGVNEYIATLPANLKPHFEKALVAR